tara:strand:- start:164 stop:988 length:825 start_codon:yes stop_codon:yes gene_type:complete
MTIVLMGITLVTPSFAFDHDPALHRLCFRTGMVPESPCGSSPQPDTAAFSGITREYALALAPTLLAPAETMGINGFQFDLQFSVTSINAAKDYWQLGIEDTRPPDAFLVSRIGVRKGLPGSFEIGMNTSYLIESELWVFGTMLKWALHEGMDVVPLDLAVRGTYSQMIGSPQLDISMVGLDVVMSKSFGVAGVVNIAPFVAYSPVWSTAGSQVIDGTPGTIDSPSGDFIFPEETQLVHRLTVGSRFIMGMFNLTGEAVLTPEQQTYSTNLGIDF